MGRPRVVVVAKRSAYNKFVEEDQDPRARELIRRADPTVRRWRSAHENHLATVQRVSQVLDELNARKWILHGPQEAFDPADADLVVSVGGDGTLLAASHNISETPILGVNSSPSHSIGFFCAATRRTVRNLLTRALRGELTRVTLTRMCVEVEGRIVSKRVLNEALFCHAIPAATSRYILHCRRRREEQRSSGIWVGTAAGSTGAMRSAGGEILPLGSEQLQFVVREPYQGELKPYVMQRMTVNKDERILLHNKMNDAWLFLDGPFKKVAVRLGETVGFKTSDEPLHVYGLDLRRPRHR
jgi:NAD+ kinase